MFEKTYKHKRQEITVTVSEHIVAAYRASGEQITNSNVDYYYAERGYGCQSEQAVADRFFANIVKPILRDDTSSEIPLDVQVLTHEDKPRLDDTYFCTSDIMPHINDGELHVYDFRGSRRSWGSPSCTSTVEMLAEGIIAVTVTGWHKHTVGPVGGTYYFVDEGGEWIRRRANAKRVKAALAA